MNNNDNSTTKTGLGFLSILTLIFVVAKILGFLSWSWWLVFSPMLILVGLFAVMYGIAGIIAIIDARKAKKASDNLFRKLRDHD